MPSSPRRPIPPAPMFDSAVVLARHIQDTLAFFEGAVDPAGGFFHFLRDDGTVFNRTTRHLVSSTRFVFTHAKAARRFPDHPLAAVWHQRARHALNFVEQAHTVLDPALPGGRRYLWQMQFDGRVTAVDDATDYAYGHAFVVLAHAQMTALCRDLAQRSGSERDQAEHAAARAALESAVATMDAAFWSQEHQLFADERDASGQIPPYRGQNANMHSCEAFLAAWDATGEAAYLDRAALLAERVAHDLANASHGLVWEHFTAAWQPDWDYNRGDTSNIFKPWGFQTGHQTEWAKLLLQLAHALRRAGRQVPQWLVPRARLMLDTGWEQGWDAAHGGLIYGFAPQGDPAQDTQWQPFDGHKYHWVQAETLAALLHAAAHEAAADPAYSALCRQRYGQLWDYAWTHFVDHRHGAWFRILAPDNAALTDEKCTAGKADYHNMGACYDMLDALAVMGGA
ncbi:AGE family epimerase/isomerase [Amphibiibacter pelophylacis]|uniref:AGE family epimerase/isomerase n=1 Tax=Amphibiibacter pelophylacis TaxID=1799477 RepID=A0ACC6NYJ6_9BURK